MESSATFGATAHETPNDEQTLKMRKIPWGWTVMTGLMVLNFILFLFMFAWLIPQFTTMKVSTTGAFSPYFWWIYFIVLGGCCLVLAVLAILGRFWNLGSAFGGLESVKSGTSGLRNQLFDRNARIYLADMFTYHYGVSGFAAVLMFGLSYFIYTDCVSGSVNFGSHINPGPAYVSGEVMCVARTYSLLVVMLFATGFIALDLMKFRFLVWRSLASWSGGYEAYRRIMPFGNKSGKPTKETGKSGTTVKFGQWK